MQNNKYWHIIAIIHNIYDYIVFYIT